MAPRDPAFSQRERRALSDLLLQLGPGAPTLCRGWQSADLAAHLVVRERRPDAAPGIVFHWAPVVAWTERVQQHVRDKMSWEALVNRLRSGPPLPLRPLDPTINTLEYFVHHEDLRRAQPDWEPRELRGPDEDLLWRHLRAIARGAAKQGVSSIEAPGRRPIVVRRGVPAQSLRGPVGELVMWVNGRRSSARALLEG